VHAANAAGSKNNNIFHGFPQVSAGMTAHAIHAMPATIGVFHAHEKRFLKINLFEFNFNYTLSAYSVMVSREATVAGKRLSE
jgi:hypothetical protein